MNEEILKKYKQAGEIVKKCKEEAEKLIKPGARVLDIVEKIESLIAREGGKPAFPLNLSVNEISAHYTPDMSTELSIKETDLVKFDVGVHMDGYIADSALTFSMNNCDLHVKLIEAANVALEKALELAKPGVSVGKIGEEVEKVITELGFKPIENLTGHSLSQYALHAGLTIPNVKNRNEAKLEEGMVIAIEPFATNGFGSVTDTNEIHIYELLVPKPTRLMEARRVLQIAEKEFPRLPFAKRWLERKITSRLKLNMALRDLINAKSLYAYPVLKEKENGLVAQAEHTVIIQESGNIITTK